MDWQEGAQGGDSTWCGARSALLFLVGSELVDECNCTVHIIRSSKDLNDVRMFILLGDHQAHVELGLNLLQRLCLSPNDEPVLQFVDRKLGTWPSTLVILTVLRKSENARPNTSCVPCRGWDTRCQE